MIIMLIMLQRHARATLNLYEIWTCELRARIGIFYLRQYLIIRVKLIEMHNKTQYSGGLPAPCRHPFVSIFNQKTSICTNYSNKAG